jgi:hypothetical protein
LPNLQLTEHDSGNHATFVKSATKLTVGFRFGLQTLAAGIGALTPLVVSVSSSTEVFVEFIGYYTAIGLAYFISAFGLDIAIAKRTKPNWRHYLTLFSAVSSAATLAIVILVSRESAAGSAILANAVLSILCAGTSAMGSLALNRILFACAREAIDALACVRISSGISLVLLLLGATEAFWMLAAILAANLVVFATSLLILRIHDRSAEQSVAPLELLPESASTFFVYSFPGLTQAIERYAIAPLDTPWTPVYLTWSYVVSALSYAGTGYERILYGRKKEIGPPRKMGVVIAALFIASLFALALVVLSVSRFGLLSIATESFWVFLFVALLAALHVVLYFSVSASIFRTADYSFHRTTAAINIVTALSVGLLAGVLGAAAQMLGNNGRTLLLICLAAWLTLAISSLLRYRKATRVIGGAATSGDCDLKL